MAATGVRNFNLPNLAGQQVIGAGSPPFGTYPIGQTGGVAQVALSSAQMPAHTHTLQSTTTQENSASPTGRVFAQGGGRGQGIPYYVAPGSGSSVPMNQNC